MGRAIRPVAFRGIPELRDYVVRRLKRWKDRSRFIMTPPSRHRWLEASEAILIANQHLDFRFLDAFYGELERWRLRAT